MSYSLLLIEDVDCLGRKGEVVKAKPGYARNFLLPKGVALVANKHTLRMQEKLSEERLRQATEDRKDSELLAKKLTEISLTIPVKVDHEGHMYAAVTSAIISDEIKSQEGIELAKQSVILKTQIKKTGSYDVAIKLKEEVMATLSITVEPVATSEEKGES